MANEVHVGDIGTKYRVRIQDDGVDFDPSSATTKQLIFRMPDGTVLVKTATVETGSGDEAGRYYLTYTVAAGEGSDGAEFHALVGPLSLQAYLEFADGTKWRTDVRKTDEDGVELRVHPNLQ